MGANASTSKYRDKSSVTIPTSSEDILRKTYQFLRWIPVSEEFDLESAAQNIAQQAQVIKHSESTVIIQKGTVGEGIYIILSGEAVVLSEGEEQQAIAHIMEGEFFGEVSCFFGNLCTATVMTVAKAKLLFLRKDMLATVLQLRVDPGNKEEQLKWFVARRYLPTTDMVPLFSVWPDEALESVALNMAEPMIIVYPPGACILRKGDPADPLLVLLRGRVMIMENEKNVQEVKSRRLAFTFGEEGLFTGSEKMLTVKAVTCCQVIQLRRHLLFKVVRQHPVTLERAWSKMDKSWRDFSKKKNSELRGTYPAACLQFETIYQRLCQAEELLKFPRSFIYELALGCEVVAVHRKLQKESTNETCGLFILKGEISVIQQEQSKTYRAGSLIGMDNTNGNKEFQTVAKEMSAVVKLTKQSMKHALESHPECELLISKNFFKTNS